MPTYSDTQVAHIFQRSSDPKRFSQFGAFRRKLFVEKLGWNLTIRNDYELDEFDHDRAHYLTVSSRDRLLGGFRAIRCDFPYLARSKFPTLAKFQPFPTQSSFWEISRFGVAPSQDERLMAITLYSLMVRFGVQRQAHGLVAFTTLGHEYYLRRMGIETKRYGVPSCITDPATGAEFKVVAGEIPLKSQNSEVLSRMISISNEVRLVDATSIQRPARVSA